MEKKRLKKFNYLIVVISLLLAACGTKNGSIQEYYPDGRTKSLANYKNNVLEGINFEYRQDGKIERLFFYSKGYCDSSYYYDYSGDTIRVVRMGGGPFKETKYLNGKLFSINIQYLHRVKGDTTYFRYYLKNEIPVKEIDTETMTDSGRVLRLIVNDTVIKTIVYYKGQNRIRKWYNFPEGTVVKDEVWSPGGRIPQPNDDEKTIEQMRKELAELKNTKKK